MGVIECGHLMFPSSSASGVPACRAGSDFDPTTRQALKVCLQPLGCRPVGFIFTATRHIQTCQRLQCSPLLLIGRNPTRRHKPTDPSEPRMSMMLEVPPLPGKTRLSLLTPGRQPLAGRLTTELGCASHHPAPQAALPPAAPTARDVLGKGCRVSQVGLDHLPCCFDAVLAAKQRVASPERVAQQAGHVPAGELTLSRSPRDQGRRV
jgi:hypothetical protein